MTTPAAPLDLLASLRRAFTASTSTPADNATPSEGLASADPNIDRTGEGVSPIEPENLRPPPVIEPLHTPAPVVSGDDYVPPGAPTHSLQVAPTQNLGVSTYTVPVGTAGPLRVAPGSSTRRRVTLTVLALAGPPQVHLAPDARQDATGAQLMNSQTYTFETGAPIFLFAPTTATVVSVIIEPLP